MDARTGPLSRRPAQQKTSADELFILSLLPPETACQKLGSNAVGLVPDEATDYKASFIRRQFALAKAGNGCESVNAPKRILTPDWGLACAYGGAVRLRATENT